MNKYEVAWTPQAIDQYLSLAKEHPDTPTVIITGRLGTGHQPAIAGQQSTRRFLLPTAAARLLPCHLRINDEAARIEVILVGRAPKPK